MPKDDTSTQSTVNSQQTIVTAPPPPPVLEDVVLPPNISSLPKQDTINPSPTDSGSAAPSNDIVMPTQEISSTPRKKFVGGKVIATILGLFLLVGGVGAGVYLVGQNQNIEEKAAPAGTCTCKLANGTNAGNGICNGSDCNCAPNLVKSNACDQAPNNGGGACNDSSLKNDKCVTGTKMCQGAGGNQTGYNCTCVDLSTNDCSRTVWSCGTLDTKACPVSGDGGTKVNTYCTGSTCSVALSSTCWVSHYRSDDKDDPVVNDIIVKEYVGSATLGSKDCGAEQIDVSCGVTEENISTRYPTSCSGGGNNPTPTPTPTATPNITASCQNLKAYSTTSNTEVPLTGQQLSALRPGNQFNLCVQGIKTGGSFDKVRFTINGALQPEQAMTDRIGTTTEGKFCTLYTIPQTLPAGGVFTFRAEMHHATLGWK